MMIIWGLLNIEHVSKFSDVKKIVFDGEKGQKRKIIKGIMHVAHMLTKIRAHVHFRSSTIQDKRHALFASTVLQRDSAHNRKYRRADCGSGSHDPNSHFCLTLKSLSYKMQIFFFFYKCTCSKLETLLDFFLTDT